MIKNAIGLILLAALPACDSADADAPSYQGVVELDERVLGFQVGGRVQKLAVDEGDSFGVGAVLATLDDTFERIQRDAQAAEARAARAQADLVLAGSRAEEIRAAAADVRAAGEAETLLQRTLDRQRVLASKGVSPEARTEELELQLAQARERRSGLSQRYRALRSGARSEERAVAEARASAAEAALRATDERLTLFTLRAKEPGQVLEVHIEQNEIVSPGAPVLTVADLDHPYVDVFVPQGGLSGIRVGRPASIRVDSERSTFAGRVEHVSRRTEFTPRYLFSERERPNLVIRVRVRTNDPGRRLHAGVPAFVRFSGRTPK